VTENTAPCTPAIAAMAGDPSRILELGDSPLRRLILPFMHDFFLRPDQVIPDTPWVYLTLRGGRGWGKTHAIAVFITREVMAGRARAVSLMATNEDRTREIQIAALIRVAPPWFKPVEERGGLTWPNGVRAEVFTPEAPEAIRSENASLTWLCEILAWPASKRMAAFQNATTATRTGNGRVLIDTTAKGRNDVITLINQLNKQNPELFPIVRGSMMSNPLLRREYLRAEFLKYVEGTRRFGEEVEGKDYDDAAGALWATETITATRRLVAPDPLDLVLIGLDPAYSDRADADETGIIVAGRKDGHTYLLRDLSGVIAPEVWAALVCETAKAVRASGVVIEVNSTAQLIPTIMKSACKTAGLVMIDVARGKPFPPHRPGVLYVKLVVSREDKYERARGPAGESLANRLHIVGDMPELEDQLTTYEPESGGKSPGRYDAAVHVVNELAGLVAVDAPDNAPAVLGAARAAADLNRALAIAAAGRRVGL
jgi:phage terminase large subunit-like protein